MDCEKFDRIVLDLLYDELDELTRAAAKRHVEQCARCRAIVAGLRATREVGVLPLDAPPATLAARILEAERQATAVLPLRKRFGRAVSILASYTMRPQLAMAALLLLMIGSSLLLVKTRPGARESVQVTERGVPESEREPVAIVPLPRTDGEDSHGAPLEEKRARRERGSAASEEAREPEAEDRQPSASAGAARDTIEPSASPDGAEDAGPGAYEAAMAAYRTGRYAEATRSFDAIAAAGGSEAGSAALYAARSLRNSAGCGAAAARFDDVGSRYRGSAIGDEATWLAADCYRTLGQLERARRNYQLLLANGSYTDRARRALDTLDGRSDDATAARASERPRPAAAAAAAAKPAPAGPAAPAPTGSAD
ncbi:MAG: hypothetical protein OZ921_03670 [Sorangiineae bacterium]|nr:hypothetical protein [Polyangiaceae bacterium]MEB2321588.1 hypothetical protein [Sorangiineae bacterium]